MKLIDQHVHTEFSIDSNQNLEDYFKVAKKRGVNYLSFTDHVDYNSLDFGGADLVVDYEGIKKRGLELEKEYGVKLNLGVEIGYRIDLEEEIKAYTKDKEYGVILMSVHQDRFGHYEVSTRSDEKLVHDYFIALEELLNTSLEYDIITHIDYVFRYIKEKHSFYDYQTHYEKILKLIISKDKILEINTKTALTMGDYSFAEFILALYRSLGGVKVSLGSDCHHVSRYQDGFSEVISIMKKQGYNYITEVVNRVEERREI